MDADSFITFLMMFGICLGSGVLVAAGLYISTSSQQRFAEQLRREIHDQMEIEHDRLKEDIITELRKRELAEKDMD